MTPLDKAIRAIAMKPDPTDADRIRLQHLQATKRQTLVPPFEPMARKALTKRPKGC